MKSDKSEDFSLLVTFCSLLFRWHRHCTGPQASSQALIYTGPSLLQQTRPSGWCLPWGGHLLKTSSLGLAHEFSSKECWVRDLAVAYFFRGFFVALICLVKQCLGLFRCFSLAFSWPSSACKNQRLGLFRCFSVAFLAWLPLQSLAVKKKNCANFGR